MGAQLAKLAYAWAADHKTSYRDFRLLVFMALTAKDTDPVPRYFAARESSALAIGRRVPDKVPKSDPSYSAIDRSRNAAFQSVKDAVTALINEGAITRESAGKQGQNAVFIFTFWPVDNSRGEQPLG